MSTHIVLLLVCIVASSFAQYTGYPVMGSLTLKLLVKGTACGASDALANKLASATSSIKSYNVTKATVVGKAPPEKTCSAIVLPPPTTSSPTSTTGVGKPIVVNSDPVKVTVFSGQPFQTDVIVEPYGMYRLLFTVQARNSGMVGIGFPTVGGLMINADAIIGWGNSALVPSNIADYSIGPERTSDCTAGGICKDFIQNLEGAEVSEVNGITTLKFLRNRIPEDSTDVTFVAPMQLQDINIALGDSYGLNGHGPRRMTTKIMIPGGVAEPASSGTTTALTGTSPLVGTSSSVPSEPTGVNTTGNGIQGPENGMAMDFTTLILFVVLGVLVMLAIILVVVLVARKKCSSVRELDFNAYSKL